MLFISMRGERLLTAWWLRNRNWVLWGAIVVLGLLALVRGGIELWRLVGSSHWLGAVDLKLRHGEMRRWFGDQPMSLFVLMLLAPYAIPGTLGNGQLGTLVLPALVTALWLLEPCRVGSPPASSAAHHRQPLVWGATAIFLCSRSLVPLGAAATAASPART